MFGRKAVLHEKPEDKKKGEEKRGWRGDKKADMKDPSDFSVPEVGVVQMRVRSRGGCGPEGCVVQRWVWSRGGRGHIYKHISHYTQLRTSTFVTIVVHQTLLFTGCTAAD